MKRSPGEVDRERLARDIAEKGRPEPNRRFFGGENEGGARDYCAHKRRFKEVTQIDGLSDRAISEELRHWFGGTAWRIVQGFAEARDSKRALVKAWEMHKRNLHFF